MRLETKRKLKNRLRRIAGQVGGLEKLVEEEAYCIDIITQTAAVKAALSAVEDEMLLHHLEVHVAEQMQSKDAGRAIDEMIKVYKLGKRK